MLQPVLPSTLMSQRHLLNDDLRETSRGPLPAELQGNNETRLDLSPGNEEVGDAWEPKCFS